jgi:hypothetical protein
MTRGNRIFIQVPSYRDPQLIETLKSLVSEASYPERLRIVVCWQHANDESIAQFLSAGISLFSSRQVHGTTIHQLGLKNAIIELIDVDYLESRGCGWARHAAQQRYAGEKYNLQIDAHHRFSAEWDTAMIEMLESLRATHKKPLLTGYPPSFDPTSYPDNRQNHVGQMLVQCFSRWGVLSYKAVKRADWKERNAPTRARFISGGFIFSDGIFVEEVMNDPQQFFSTEEIVTAARAYTNGYDFFHPHRPLLWHQYNSSAPKVWEDHTEQRKSAGAIVQSAEDRSIEALQRSLSLLNLGGTHHISDFGRYGLGTQRTLQQYERYAGISLLHRGVHAEALLPSEPDESHFDTPSSLWEAALICRRHFQIIIEWRPAQSFALRNLQVTSASPHGRQVAKRDLSETELNELLHTGSLEYLEEFESSLLELPTEFSLKFNSDQQSDTSSLSISAREVWEA